MYKAVPLLHHIPRDTAFLRQFQHLTSLSKLHSHHNQVTRHLFPLHLSSALATSLSALTSSLWYQFTAVHCTCSPLSMIPQLKHKGRHDPQPKVTFYLTLVFELHGGTDQYTYSIE